MSEQRPESAAKHSVRIHIDQEPYESPNPTTGASLYALAGVRPGHELYREVSGDREDEPVPNSAEHVHLKHDEHFHSGEPHKKEFTIFVNARKKTVTTRVLSFEQVVALAFDPVPANAIFTVTYRGGEHPKEGSLQPGQRVKVKEGMAFNVTETGQS